MIVVKGSICMGDRSMEIGKEISPDAKFKIHSQICSDILEMYKKKNNDYGDSFARLREIFDSAILIRLYDKYHRLESLKDGTEQRVNDESVEDTLMDLAGYCILELIEIRLEKQNSKKESVLP